MTTFWERKIAERQTAPPQPAQPLQTVGQTPQHLQYPQYAAQTPQYQAPPGYVLVQAQGAPQNEVYGQHHIGELLGIPEYTTTKAQSLRQSEVCPECLSENYLSAKPGHYAPICDNCGYNPRFQQSMAGVSAPSGTPVVTSARRQVQVPVGAAPMNSIIAHVGVK